MVKWFAHPLPGMEGYTTVIDGVQYGIRVSFSRHHRICTSCIHSIIKYTQQYSHRTTQNFVCIKYYLKIVIRH